MLLISSYIGRVGETGQLAPLLETTSFVPSELDALEDAWLHDLHAVREMENLQQVYLKQRAMIAEGDLQSVQARASTVDLMSDVSGGQGNDLARDLSNAVQLLSNGTARCVSLKHRGWQIWAMTLMLPLLFKQAIFSNCSMNSRQSINK